MRVYLWTMSAIFAVLTILHAWRAIAESHALARDPWFLIITLASAALCVWSLRLLRSARA